MSTNRPPQGTAQATSPVTPTPIPASSVISARGLTKVFGSGEQAVIAVNEIELDIMPGEFLAVTGRSGSGKTTLLNLLAGLDQPTKGGVVFEGRNLNEFSESQLVDMRRSRIGFVFQSFGLIPLLSAYENVELPLHIGGARWRERRQRAGEALELVGLGSRTGHRPYELSGGEQQRVAIAPGPGNRTVGAVCRRTHRRVGQCYRHLHCHNSEGHRSGTGRHRRHRHP